MTRTLAQTNARLTEIREQGLSPDAELPAAPGTIKWSGNVDAYFTDQLVTNRVQAGGAGQVDLLRKTYLVFPSSIRPKVTVDQGDFLTFTVQGVTKTRQVRDVAAPFVQGIDTTTRVFFEDE